MADEETTETTALDEQLPEEIRSRVDERIPGSEEIELTVSTDVRPDGQYGEGWLVATRQRLIAYSPNGHGTPEVIEIPIADITGVELRELVGLGVLKIRTDERGATVARFSKTLLPKFSEVPERLEALVREARTVADDEELVDSDVGRLHGRKRRCERCGRVLHHHFGVCHACLDTRKLLLRLLSYSVPYWRVGAFSLVLMLLATFIGLTQPQLMRTLVDDVLKPVSEQGPSTWVGGFLGDMSRREMLGVLVLLLLLVHVSLNIMGALRRYLLSYLGQRVTFDLRNQVYAHLHLLSLSFYNDRETGRIMASITQDVGRLQDFISDGLQEIIRDVLTIIIICIFLFTMNPGLAALVLLPTPLLVLFTIHFGEKLHDIYHTLWRRWAGMSALLADTIPGVRVVKAFAQERREVSKFANRSGELLTGEMRVARMRSVFSPIMAFITSLGTLIIWWVGGNKVLGETLTLGDFVAFTGYMMRFFGPVESLCRLNHRFQRAATSAERVFETLDSQPDVADAPNVRSMPRIEGRVEFRDVTFSYEPGKPVLTGIELDVEAGEMIGLAGHSGAGKSTVINLIGRFYDVDEGAILIDGQNIREVGLKSLRDQMGVVLQDPFLFNGTAAENIAYGKPKAELDEIVAAGKAAHAHEFIMNLPDGYDTPVGERGVRISGGERQRISIARAILRDPRILILDEATSNVDTETEVKIQEALERLIRGRTTFAIAHRLSTLRHANRLLILEKGAVAEVGTHDELLEQDGIYAKLCRMQTEMSKLRAW
ncbi:ABC transporter transmembrane domain-containing protein [Candidatus Latescibacterota bacterium]